ncbi:MAG: OmpA family protein [Bacteroidales bacterium]|jgi:peptidoglycan-associated lipoprotein|nr:OmpA family protein [Bacteroidales bacterium]MCK9447462.1 OmpA family protein [Bacteroidales bacterium]MDD3700664.1 OmpA family protein [Bacteroidales bacterium]MDY0368213.1 OmpA family protein [Bacteroidales bacterium]
MKHPLFTFSILIALLWAPSLELHAQRNVSRSADEAFERHQYSLALDRYKKAYGKVKRNSDERSRISYRMAECYRFTGSTKRAEATYKRVLRTDLVDRYPEIYLIYADLLKMNQKFEESIEYYQLYTERQPDDPRGRLGAETASLAAEWLENPSRFEVELLKKLNSRAADFAPAWASENYNEIIFTSTRDGSTGKEKDRWTDQNFSDLYRSRLDRNQQWSTPVLIDNDEIINTEGNEGAPFMNSSFTTLYFTRCKNTPQHSSGCQIYTSTRSGRGWGPPSLLQIRGIDSLDVIGHPTLSSNELILYFSAERKGGFGGRDIWVALRENTSQGFNRPMNLGEVINTKGDEIFPFLRNDTTLFFASNGHGGLGGFDIFVSVIDTAGNWGAPTNLKYPINSPADDFSIIFHPAEERGFFASNRDNIRGIDNLYSFIEPPVLFTLAGTIKDEKTLQYVEDASVRLVGSNGMSVSTRTNDKGYYLFGSSQLDKNTTYEIIVDKDFYFTKTAIETTVGVEFSRDFEKDILLEPIPEKPIPLPEILYDLARWELKPQYEDSLQGLIETLQHNPTIVIELASHTDNRDTEERNDILSQRRAQSVVDYLILRGIDPERLVAKGYGERVPRTIENDFTANGVKFKAGTVLTESYIDNLKTETEKEVAHQLNRRTEFRVLSKDYIPKSAGQEMQAKVEIQINPEDNQIGFTINEEGSFEANCLVDGFNETFVYNRTENASISLPKALDWLKKGIIHRDNLVGEAEILLEAGSVADGAVFIIHEIRIANKIVQEVEVNVLHRQKDPLVFGQRLLSRFGDFEFDAPTKKLIFTP